MEDLNNIIKNSKSAIFLTSAGLSAESGIPTFRDKDGYWRNFPAFKKKGLEAIELASPASFRKQAHHSWAFYEWRRRNARENTPHKGYAVINRLINEYFENSFVHTTNTDGYHIISGLDEDKVYEVHGSLWRLQCMNGSYCSYGYRNNDDVPLCELDYETMSASNMPVCPECGSLLRPNILMFGDYEYVEHNFQYPNFKDFISGVSIPDVAFLIGSSGAVPTNDYLAERLKRSGTKIVTINPDSSSTLVCSPHIFMQEGAVSALTKIENIAFNS